MDSPLPNSTVSRLLDGAERSLLSHGYEGSSIRRITREAGANVASINYHFGSKKELFAALVRRRLDAVTQRRDEALVAIGADAAHAIEDAVRAYFDALLHPSGHAGREAAPAVWSLLMTEPAISELAGQCFDERYVKVRRRYAQALAAMIPGVPVEEIEWRLSAMERFALSAIAGPGACWAPGLRDAPGAEASPPEGALPERVIAVIQAALLAPFAAPGNPKGG